MDSEKKSEISAPTTSGSWPLGSDLPDLSSSTLNSVFASDPLTSNSDFSKYLQNLGEHDDPLLSSGAVSSIKDIFKHDEGKIGTKQSDQNPVDQTFDLSLPSSYSPAHVQRRPSQHDGVHQRRGVLSSASNETHIADALLQDIEIMQVGDESAKEKLSPKKDAIKEGLKKIKQQLGKSDKIISGPAVVTQFIDNSASLFSEDLDDSLKCSMDNASAKEFYFSPRRSSRKTTRLFDIVGPKSRKHVNEKHEEEESPHLGSESKSHKEAAKGTVSESEAKRNWVEDDGFKRRSTRTYHKEEETKQGEESKKKGRGRLVKFGGTSDNEDDRKGKFIRRGLRKEKSPSDDERKQGRKLKKDVKREMKNAKSKKKIGGKKILKGEKKEKIDKKKGDEEDESDEDKSDEDDSDDSSVLDDGELSDGGSEFDPDEDPDRLWCICKKPHGNRFMICCDTCEDWFHGECVGITQADGREMEKHGEEWMCPKCKRKLQALAKELKEKERLERLKNRFKSDDEKGSSDEKVSLSKEKSSEKVRQKLLRIIRKANGDRPKIRTIEDNELPPLHKDELDVDSPGPVKKRFRLSAEDKEAKEARRLEEEIEWKRRLKEMKARQMKAEMEAKRRESTEGGISFDKIGSQKIAKVKAEPKRDVKLERLESPAKVKSKIGLDMAKERRKSDSTNDRKVSSLEASRRVSFDLQPKERLIKRETSEESEESPKKQATQKKVRITPTPKTLKPSGLKSFCIVCNKPAMKSAVYCSKDCMASYTKESLRLISENKLKRLGMKSESGKGSADNSVASKIPVLPGHNDDRITVLERSTGKVLAGLIAPTKANIFTWVEEHPTFEVFRPVNSNNSSQKDKRDLTEVIRSNVKKSLKETILARCRDYEMEVNVDEVSKICHAIEEEIVKMFGDTGQKYKTKYRSLIFNLKDPKNRNLYKQVVQGDLSPSKLVHMTPEQLASAELARWREKEAKHNLEMIKKREEEEATMSKHAVKKTHKGEVEIQTEDEDMRNLESHIEVREEPKEDETEAENSGISFEDTTSQHSSHLFDLNCKICTGKQLSAGQQPILPHVSTSAIQTVSETSVPSPTDSPSENDLKENSPDVESMSKSPVNIPLLSKERFDSVWKGFVSMQGVAKFATSAYRVSGSCEKLIQLLPDTIHICGRISHEQVWDYLFQLKEASSSKVIDVLRFEMAADEEKAAYCSLYSYFYTRKRIGVIGNCFSGVKDMYIVPIAAHDPIPSELKPFDGPGLPEPRPHMLIGIIVRKKSAVNVPKRSKTSYHHSSEPVTKKSKKHSKEKHRKDERKHAKKSFDSPYEDIIFGKQKHAIRDVKYVPSETSSPYTPDAHTPTPSTSTSTSVDTSLDAKEDAKLKLEEKLEKQKEELLRLQAEIQAKRQAKQGADTLLPSRSTPIALTTDSSVVATSASALLSPATAVVVPTSLYGQSNRVTQLPSTQSSSSLASSYSLASESQEDEPYDPENAFFDKPTSAQSTPAAYRPSSTSYQPIKDPSKSSTGMGVVKATDKASADDEPYDPQDSDEPYDPEDAIESDLKEPDPGTNDASKQSAGDEPYDPEDEFVMDLIEDISLPNELKKIDKPNLPFPLEISKKEETKMPELPPIRLPEKLDRRAANFPSFISSTLVDPRSNASPSLQAATSQGPSPVSSTDSPGIRVSGQLSSPPSAQETGRSAAGARKSSSDSGMRESPKSEATAPNRISHSDSRDVFYQSPYENYSTSYPSAQDSSYHRQWQGSYSTGEGSEYRGQRSGYDRYGPESRERGSDSWNRSYHSRANDYKSDGSRHGDYSNYTNDKRDGSSSNRSFDDFKGSSGGTGRGQDRGRGSQWR
eukprot:gene12134-13387_t